MIPYNTATFENVKLHHLRVYMQQREANELIHASSPYLQQHAHNPVKWKEWNEDAWKKARKENKLVLVSVGYAACHWCHVMEHETFENEEAAALMNEYLVCIKVDREERPDVDQVYMDAAQLMTGRGGWPLNVFCLPDGKPIYGGTYYPRENWMAIIKELAKLWELNPEKAIEFGEKLTKGINDMDLLKAHPVEEIGIKTLQEMLQQIVSDVDTQYGGTNRVPKFPLPNHWNFLLHYHELFSNETAFRLALFTLEKMAWGGIYDQLGGGFARYSTDEKWLVPHFEKMLYDNAQLLSVLAKAFHLTKNQELKKLIDHTTNFLVSELSNGKGAYYSSLDADSEGEEGKYYVWQYEEIQKILGNDAPFFCEAYQVEAAGNWEHGKNILHRTKSLEELAALHAMTIEQAENILHRCAEKLLQVRKERVRPGLDDKVVCSWQALTIQAFAEIYLSTGDEKYRTLALEAATYLSDHLWKDDQLYRISKNHKTSIPAFMEDYACTIAAFLELYQVSFDESHLRFAKQLCEQSLKEFYDAENGLFFFTAESNHSLIARKVVTSDDVISSSNSIMAGNLLKLAAYFGDMRYKGTAVKMLHKVGQQIIRYPAWHTQWCSVAATLNAGLVQVVATGPGAMKMLPELRNMLKGNIIFAVSEKTSSDLSVFEGRLSDKETRIFICRDEVCEAPVRTTEEAIQLL